MIAWSKTDNHIGGSLPSFMRKFGKGDFLSAFYIFFFEISEANVARSKAGKNIGGSIPSFMCKFGKGDFLSAFYFQIPETNDSLE